MSAISTQDATAAPKKPKKNQPSDLAKSEERLAYWLLAPTFLILFAIGFYPLFSVFYNSFTDRQLASNQPVEWVGFDNYSRLLSMTITELPREIDEETGQPAIDPDTGEPEYVLPLEVLPREPRRFRELSQFNWFGTRYVLGATDPDFLLAFIDTVRFTFFAIILETVLGLGIALVVNSNFKGRGAMRAVMLVPWVIPTAVSSRIWEWMFTSTRTGLFNVVFQDLGLGDGRIAFLVAENWQLPAMVMIDVWKTTPFMALLILAGLQLIPKDIYEAADVDGASTLRTFFSITLPLLRPTIAVALVFRTLDTLRVFDLFQIVLGQKRYSLASFTYYELVNNQSMGYSSASSVLIFFLIFIFAFLYIRFLGVTNE
ncbi:carbohydrate ABC transporter permease [Candidatus Leptofilum sp.]|uniref:carbohydrate ABC transporter permease n=1 Tax=Candidatus Leptofilum sp. TaxID=3241576 RepID=UPI003B5AF374